MELKKYFKKYIGLVITAISLMLCYLLVQYSVVGADAFKHVYYYCNAFFISGGVLFCFGMFALINLWGGFDIFKYLVSKEKNQQHLTLRDYSEIKSEQLKKEKKGIYPWFMVAGVLIVVAIILNMFVF